MRCLICNVKLKKIIDDDNYRGGIRPCTDCQGIMRDASLDRVHLYDDSDDYSDVDALTNVVSVDGDKQT